MVKLYQLALYYQSIYWEVSAVFCVNDHLIGYEQRAFVLFELLMFY